MSCSANEIAEKRRQALERLKRTKDKEVNKLKSIKLLWNAILTFLTQGESI